MQSGNFALISLSLLLLTLTVTKAVAILGTPGREAQTLQSATMSLNSSRTKRSSNEILDSVLEISRSGLICNLCIVLDEQFINAYKLTDQTQIINFIKKIVDRVSWIFRTIDWNEDGTPDNIGVETLSLLKGWNPYATEYSASYDTPKPAMELLGLFASQNFAHCCLGVGLTNRPFEKNQVGVSFIASENLLGGVCDFRAPPPPLKSANVALISARGIGGSQLSEKDLGHVLLHELGHTFGVSTHDIELDPKCSGYNSKNSPIYIGGDGVPEDGRYIMWGQDIQGISELKPNNLDFSPCSKSSVSRLLYSGGSSRGGCLTRQIQTPFCGNGIVEPPEECDCGNELNCTTSGCCGARGSLEACIFIKGEEGGRSPQCLQGEASKKFKKSGGGLGLSFDVWGLMITLCIHCWIIQ